GVTGPTGAMGPSPTLAFQNNTSSIAVYPPLNTEVTVASTTTNTIANQNIKVDYALTLELTTNANNSFTVQVRLYRNTTLLQTRFLIRNQPTAGTARFPIADTYVDTAPTTGPTTYQLRVFTSVATNVTSGNANNRNINVIVFP
ncbi:MAG: hypothetical protein ACO1OT_07795, partial [Heyndrickxia sp.]